MSSDEFRTGHVGKSMDLYWTFETVIPTEKEYLQMVDASMRHVSLVILGMLY